jgi:hypothetical protein
MVDTQLEHLHLIGLQALEAYARNPKTADRYCIIDGRLKDIVKGISSSENIEIFDPGDAQSRKVPAKQAMVQNAMRRFERENIHFPLEDTILRGQLLAYIEKRVTSGGMPIYVSRSPESIGDHVIDALFLTLWAFTKEMGILGGPQLEIQMDYTANVLFKSLEGKSVELRDINPGRKTSFDTYSTSDNFGSVVRRGFGDEDEYSPEAANSLGSLINIINRNKHSSLQRSNKKDRLDPDLSLIKDTSQLNGPRWGKKIKRSFSREI